ncbi:type VI secretion system tube protein TssD [Spirosoma areae]
MAYEGTLSIDGTDFPINWMFLRVVRNENQRGEPASRPEWGVVVSLDAMEDKAIKNWMIDPNLQKDGKIVLNRIDEDGTFKEIEFKKAYCVFYKDEFFADIEYLNTVINISGGEVKFNKGTVKV